MMSLNTSIGSVLSSPAAKPAPAPLPAVSAFDRSLANQAAMTAAAARAAAIRTDDTTAAANDAQSTSRAADVPATIPNVMDSLSTVAVVGAMSSLPAALNMMRDIVAASGSGTLSDADRATLASEYAQLSQQVGSVVGPVGASQQSGAASSGKDDEHDASNPYRETSDDDRSTLTRLSPMPMQYTMPEPVEKLVTTTSATVVPDGNEVRAIPSVVLHTNELHVGTDSYEPAATRQTQTRLSRPATLGRIEHHATTHRVLVAQVQQITQLSQVAQVAPLSAVA